MAKANTAAKEKARQLRLDGMAITKIAKELSVAKSSVSLWVRDLPQPEEFTAEARRSRKEERLRKLRESRKPRKERLISGDGRWMIRKPPGYTGKAYIGDRYIYEHRYLMEQKIGRLLKPDEVVHHKNHDKLDNRIENLELMTRAQHSALHAAGKVSGM